MRTVVQLLLIGLVLESVFAVSKWYAVLGLLLLMTTIAGVSAVRRTNRRFRGMYVDSIVAVWSSSWIVAGYALLAVLREVEPWYQPQYAIPLTGMILGNSLNGISLGLSRLGDQLVLDRDRIEAALALGLVVPSRCAARPALWSVAGLVVESNNGLPCRSVFHCWILT